MKAGESSGQRRQFLKASFFGVASAALARHTVSDAQEPQKDGAQERPVGENERTFHRGPLPKLALVDTHQHLWSLKRMAPPWLEGASGPLRNEYLTEQYQAATKGLNVSAVYMEVDMAPENQFAEAVQILELIAGSQSLTRAAVIGGRPAAKRFVDYLDRFERHPAIKGVRQVLHGDAPRGFCLQPEFLSGMRALGERNLSFDLCVRPGELGDVEQLVRKVPGTRFILDHCGNPDVSAFKPKANARSHDPEQWKRDIEKLAKFENLDCKISGIIAKATGNWQPSDFASIVNHCLDSFGPKRVVFGGDWPVCLLGASLLDWVAALHEIIMHRPKDEQLALWSENAKRVYNL